MGKKKQDSSDKASIGSNKASMEAKRSQRARQSAADKEAARKVDGWVASRKTKDLVLPKHRCEKCHNPSASCRRGAKKCASCDKQSGAAANRNRQAAREGKVPVSSAVTVATTAVVA